MVRGLMSSARAISLFDIPCSSQARTSHSLFERPLRIFALSDKSLTLSWNHCHRRNCKIQTNALDCGIERALSNIGAEKTFLTYWKRRKTRNLTNHFRFTLNAK